MCAWRASRWFGRHQRFGGGEWAMFVGYDYGFVFVFLCLLHSGGSRGQGKSIIKTASTKLSQPRTGHTQWNVCCHPLGVTTWKASSHWAWQAPRRTSNHAPKKPKNYCQTRSANNARRIVCINLADGPVYPWYPLTMKPKERRTTKQQTQYFSSESRKLVVGYVDNSPTQQSENTR